MRNPRVDYTTVGAFVLAMLVALVVCLALLTGRTGATDTYTTHFDNVLGVIPGTQLFFEGYPVGQVEKIEPSEDPARKRYRVTLSVEEGWPIPEDSVAWITEPSLLAAITIDIHSGTSPTMLEPGGDIQGRDLQSVFTAVNTLAAEMETIVARDIRPLLDTVADVSPRILANLESVTEDLATATEQVTLLFGPENTNEIDGMIGDFSQTARNLQKLSAALDSSLQRIDDMVGSLDGLVSGNTEQIQGMLDDLSHTLESVARHVDTINANLESTSHNMNEFSRQIRRNPGVLVRGTSGDGDGAP